MKIYGKDFYDQLWNTAFSRLTLKDYIDRVQSNRYNSDNFIGFRWGDIQNETEWTQTIMPLDITPMAIVTDFDSPVIPFSNTTAKYKGGSFPRSKSRREFNEQDVRKQMEYYNYDGATSFRDWAEENMFVTTDKLVQSQINRQMFFRNTLVSNGEIKISKDNNPYGLGDLYIAGNVPKENITTKTGNEHWWTGTIGGAEGSSSNPVEDLKNMVDQAEYDFGLVGVHFEIERTTAKQLVKHSKVLEAIAANANPSAPSSSWAIASFAQVKWENRLEILGDIVGAKFVVIDHLAANETYNKSTRAVDLPTIRTFNPNTVVLVPDGIIGDIVTLRPLPIGRPENFEYFLGGRGLIITDWDVHKKVEYIETELTATPVLGMPQYMFYIDFMGTAGIKGVSAPLNYGDTSKEESSDLEKIVVKDVKSTKKTTE